MKRCAVLGSPISHSLSPLIHTTAYAAFGLTDWVYEAHEVTVEGFRPFVASCGPEWVGLSCTMPLKQVLLECGEPTQVAAMLGAANTYLFGHGGGRPRVDNTDVAGFVRALGWSGVASVPTARLLGAGATARAATAALGRLGTRTLRVVARDAARARSSLARIADHAGVDLVLEDWAGALAGPPVDLLVSTLPLMPQPDEAAALASRAAVVFDVFYETWPTTLNRAADAAGAVSLDGVDLLVGQAVDQIRLMTGREPAYEPLLHVARNAVAARQPEG